MNFIFKDCKSSFGPSKTIKTTVLMWCLSNKKKRIKIFLLFFFLNKPLIKVAKVEETLTETLNKYTSALNMIHFKRVGMILGVVMTITVFTCSHFGHLDSSSLSRAAWNLFDREQIKGMLKQISIVMNSAERKWLWSSAHSLKSWLCNIWPVRVSSLPQWTVEATAFVL